MSRGYDFARWPRKVGAFLVGTPQIYGIVPCVILAAYWFGGEGAMVGTALALPALFVIVSAVPGRRARLGRDGLTGLRKRQQAEAYLNEALLTADSTGQGAAAIALEIDDFDRIRAQFGPQVAGTILRQIGERLETTTRGQDVVAHLSGQRFAMALGSMRLADLETLIDICGRVQANLAEPFLVNAAHIYLTASFGFALPGQITNHDGAELLRSAEIALDDARATATASIRAYSRNLSRRMRDRRALGHQTLTALENGQIAPWFQPQVSTHDGRITGFETVPFWEHPDQGPIPLRDFEDQINSQGQGERLAEIMLSGALRALGDWDRQGLAIPAICVPLGHVRMTDPRVVDKLAWELDRFSIAPERLFVEIHEDVVAAASDDLILRNVSRLAELGCKIDLDDFGTGHASIANIRRFAVHRIRIDKSFVARVDRDRDQQNMVAAVLTMAERLSLDTIAEGVETAGEHAMLAQLGCNSVQGYSIGGPMPFADTVAWIEKHNARLPDLASLRPGTGV